MITHLHPVPHSPGRLGVVALIIKQCDNVNVQRDGIIYVQIHTEACTPTLKMGFEAFALTEGTRDVLFAFVIICILISNSYVCVELRGTVKYN